MNVLIVHAHPEAASMCAAMKDRAAAVLRDHGHEVVISDLYAMGFKSVAHRSDFTSIADPDFLKYQVEQFLAASQGGFASDIAAEQAKLAACDLLILNFPLWWFSLPAILKGWVDRVFAAGVCYGRGKVFATGGLCGRRAMLAVTTGGDPERFTDAGGIGPLEPMLRHVTYGMLNWVGFEVLPSVFVHAPARMAMGERATQLDAYAYRLMHLAAPMYRHP